MTYQEAEAYIAQINADNFGGYNDWRLPTVEELLSLLEQERPVLFFRLTAEAFDKLKSGDEPLPEDVLERMKPLQDQKIFAEADFIKAAQQLIKNEEMALYQTRILKQAKVYGLYINPMFDSTQSWVWSSDIFQRKGEG
ncbi:hypothetical protein U14_05048 [Candidatus Moduliflexus flocculans]|uniref:Lcl C-terminal domain-containing protein n=1 Tax=Candidatus Moduliflexus flocculans TaxID=1499966 RepID=A0A081BQU3_9BACT|nr:hypothetical protein U14_05048 [Candidatus Moduliflexus flocculans]